MTELTMMVHNNNNNKNDEIDGSADNVVTQQQQKQQCSKPRDHILSCLQYLGNNGPYRLILASQSPRRREILDMMGLAGRYQVIPSPLKEEEVQRKLMMMMMIPPEQHSTDTDDDADSTILLSPQEYTRQLAMEKAMALAQVLVTRAKDTQQINHQTDGTMTSISNSTSSDNNNLPHIPTLVLGSDTIVELEGNVLEKPKDVTDARTMLMRLSGHEHQVHTGVALYLATTVTTTRTNKDGASTPTDPTSSSSSSSIRLLTSFTDTAHVTFASLSPQDIESYLATGEPLDKAGSYGIQGVGGQFVTRITGDFFTVMGLPAHRTSQALATAISELGWCDE